MKRFSTLLPALLFQSLINSVSCDVLLLKEKQMVYELLQFLEVTFILALFFYSSEGPGL